MTRERAKEIALRLVNESIKREGEDGIYMMCPKPGKNTWTYKEAKESILEDKSLEDTNTNIIDLVIEYDEYAKKHNIKSPKDLVIKEENENVKDFYSVYSHEEVEKVDKRISELQEKYEQKLREAQWKAKDFPMMDKL